ncbi:MAG TPA: FAD-dependent oxidoreductase [Polyangiaceae bacterium]
MLGSRAEERVRLATSYLSDGKPAEAIEQLRDPEIVNRPEVCATLARAYFQRGDSKGDVYSAQYFAGRALELGDKSRDLPAIVAASAFRREDYGKAVEYFERVISERSSATVQFLYGLALFELGNIELARVWLERAAASDPGNSDVVAARDAARQAQSSGAIDASRPTRRFWERASASLGGLKYQRPLDVPSLRRSNALSLLRGLASAPKDFAWAEANVPCQSACPANTDIPGYLQSIYAGDYEGAYRINLRDNVMPGVLGRVCARPCEGACRHGWEGLGESVAICHSKRAAADLRDTAPVVLPAWFAASGKTVAIVGGGPAGLAAARELARMGHRVTLFERHREAGGMLNQGIPEFRLPRDVISREIQQIELQGVEIRVGIEIGRDIEFGSLLAKYDAVVLAAGTLRPNWLDLPGKHYKGIRHGLDFLLEVNVGDVPMLGERVIVIGGGFTAMDCARTAARLGATTVELSVGSARVNGAPVLTASADSVKVLYRRSINEMLVTPGELEELEQEGIPMEFMVAPVAFLGDESGQLTGMRFVRTALGEPDQSGRRRPVAVPGSEFDLAASAVLLATGQFPSAEFISASYAKQLVDAEGWLTSGKSTKTAIDKLFVAGDFATGASSIIGAIGHAKQCARDVDRYLMGVERLKDMVDVTDAIATGRIREMDDEPRIHLPVLPVPERTLSNEVELGYSDVLAADETQRCYLCHYKFEIDPAVCIFCDWCVKAKPRPDCIVKVSQLLYDDADRISGFQRASSTEDTQLIWINQADCIRCGACVEACPVDAISLQKVSLVTVPSAAE